MKRRAFIDRMAQAIIGVGLFGSALFGKRDQLAVAWDEVAEIVLERSMVGRTIVVSEGDKFSSRTLEFADDGTIQPNFPFDDHLVPRSDNWFFLEEDGNTSTDGSGGDPGRQETVLS